MKKLFSNKVKGCYNQLEDSKTFNYEKEYNKYLLEMQKIDLAEKRIRNTNYLC